MKNIVTNTYGVILLCLLTNLLVACGSGGSSKQSVNYSINANTNTIAFSNEVLQATQHSFQVDVTFQGDGLLVGFAPDSEVAPWLNYRIENLTATSATVHVEVINADVIQSDLYQTTLRLSTGNIADVNLVHHDIDVSLLIWQLTVDTDLLSFRATFGDSNVSEQSLTLTSSENQWTAATDVDWLTIDVSEGTGDQVIVVAANISQFTSAGLYQGHVIFTEVTSGDTKKIAVELGLDNLYLFSDQPALLLSKTANSKANSAAIIISTNSPLPITWQASSSATWLNVSRQPDSNILQISVDESIPLSEQLNLTTISISATDNDAVIAATIPISYYLSNELTENLTINDVVVNDKALVNSPYLPYVYAGINNQLRVYHQYTGELIKSLEVAPENSLLQQLIMHPKGHTLLAKAEITTVNEDQTTSTVTKRYKIDLTDHSFIELTDITIEYEPLQYLSFSGRHFIISQTLEFADDNLQRLFWQQSEAFFVNTLDQADNTGALYVLDANINTFKRYLATVNDFTDQTIVSQLSHQYRPELLAEDQTIQAFIVDDNELGIYAISPSSEWISFDGDTFVDTGLLPQEEDSVAITLAKSRNNRAHYLRFDANSGFLVNVYNQQQQINATVATQGQQPRSIELSADDKRLIINAVNAQQIELITMEQLDLSTSELNFSSTFGNQVIAGQQITVNGLSEGWLIASNVDWLTLTTSTVDGQVLVEVDINIDNITTWGLYSGAITITDPLTGTSSVITVNLAIDAIHLSANYPAIAFNQLDTQSQLVHQLDILTNSATPIDWQATTTVDWLTLTADKTNNKLLITADANAVANNGQHQAEIILSPTVNGTALPGKIKVNLNKGDVDAQEVIINDISINDSGAVLDPLRPYFYVAQGDQILVFDLIGGSLLTAIDSLLPEVDLTNLVIHPDGSFLLASNLETYIDEQEQEQSRVNHYQLTLADFTLTAIDSDKVSIDYRPQAIVMVSGRPVVVTQTLELANTDLTRQYWDTDNVFFTQTVHDVKSTNALQVFNANESAVYQYQLTVNDYAEQFTGIVDSKIYQNELFSPSMTSIASNSSGSNLYTADESIEWSTFDGESFSEQGVLHNAPILATLATTTDSSDHSYFYRFNAIFGYTISKYDQNQVLLWEAIHTQGANDIYISSDYQRLISYNSSTLTLVFDATP